MIFFYREQWDCGSDVISYLVADGRMETHIGPIYLVDQKLGFDPKFGICPNFWDLSQFLGFDPIFGKNPNIWDLQPHGQGIGERGCP